MLWSTYLLPLTVWLVQGQAAHSDEPALSPTQLHRTGLALKQRFLRLSSSRNAGCSERDSYTPPNYVDSGCFQRTKVMNEIKYEGTDSGMSIEKCYAFCKGRPENPLFFGVTTPPSSKTECWCASLFVGHEMPETKCEAVCSGNPDVTCGGTGTSKVFTMFDCRSGYAAEAQNAEIKQQGLANSAYDVKKGQSCGNGKNEGDNLVKITPQGSNVPSETLIGYENECKQACSLGHNSFSCQGFTYEKNLQRCFFSLRCGGRRGRNRR